MTLHEVYLEGKNRLQKAGIDSPAFDAVCLFEHVFGLGRQELLIHGQEPADSAKIQQYDQEIAQRGEKRPLQYILGQWEFLSMKLKVGEGVLIPREETELLVHTAVELLTGKENPLVYDLCAGTGAVGLGVASLVPSARVICVELFDSAFQYLSENITQFGDGRVKSIHADVLDESSPALLLPFGRPDLILSNPPYVESDMLLSLQDEVRREPQTALDGGGDGLLFYRKLAELWLPLLENGAAAVEIGENQAEAVAGLFESAGLSPVKLLRDFNGLPRVICGQK